MRGGEIPLGMGTNGERGMEIFTAQTPFSRAAGLPHPPHVLCLSYHWAPGPTSFQPGCPSQEVLRGHKAQRCENIQTETEKKPQKTEYYQKVCSGKRGKTETEAISV